MIKRLIYLFIFFNLFAGSSFAKERVNCWKLYLPKGKHYQGFNYKTVFSDTCYDKSKIRLFDDFYIYERDLLVYIDNDSETKYSEKQYSFVNAGNIEIDYSSQKQTVYVVDVKQLDSLHNIIASYLIMYNKTWGLIMKSYLVEYGAFYYFLHNKASKQNNYTNFSRIQKSILQQFEPLL